MKIRPLAAMNQTHPHQYNNADDTHVFLFGGNRVLILSGRTPEGTNPAQCIGPQAWTADAFAGDLSTKGQVDGCAAAYRSALIDFFPVVVAMNQLG